MLLTFPNTYRLLFENECKIAVTIIFKDREDAAKRLANKLKLLVEKSVNELIILAIPRGGVLTGDAVASRLGAKLDIVVSRKIGAPYNSELAIGAVMHDGSFFPNEDVIKMLNVSQEYVDEQISIQKKDRTSFDEI